MNETNQTLRQRTSFGRGDRWSPLPFDKIRLFVRRRRIVRTILQTERQLVAGRCLLQMLLSMRFFPWQSIFPSANITPNTTKTVGGESSPTVFTFKCALFCFTVYALFREPSLAIAKLFQKSFCGAFFKKRPRPRIPRVLASPASPRGLRERLRR